MKPDERLKGICRYADTCGRWLSGYCHICYSHKLYLKKGKKEG